MKAYASLQKMADRTTVKCLRVVFRFAQTLIDSRLCTYFDHVHLLAVVHVVDRETTLTDEVVRARVLLHEKLVCVSNNHNKTTVSTQHVRWQFLHRLPLSTVIVASDSQLTDDLRSKRTSPSVLLSRKSLMLPLPRLDKTRQSLTKPEVHNSSQTPS